MNLHFPKDFLWGASTSSHQVEGGNRNDWSEWEQEHATRLAREAVKYEKLPSWPFISNQATDPQNYISGRACDHYHRYEEDFDIAKSLGHNAHRFSIEWSRVEPEEGKFDEREIEHYRNVIKALRTRGLEPFVTLWHWTLPLWVRDQGGWENKKTIDDFLKYQSYVMRTIGSDIRFWIPINEPTIYSGLAYAIGWFPPCVKSLRRTSRVLKNLLTAHRKAYVLLHQEFQHPVFVGSAHNVHYNVPARNNFIDYLALKIFEYIRDLRPLYSLRGYEDFIGLNYYFRDHVAFAGVGGRYGIIDIKNPNNHVSDLGWDIAPEGIYHVLKKVARRKLPIYITENGIADAHDEKRELFIRKHLQEVKKALEEGIDVRGYFYWSLLDNFEWDKGFWPRFGLVEIDYKTLERKIRPSAYEYKKIIEERSL